MNYKKGMALGVALSMMVGANVQALSVGADVLSNQSKNTADLMQQMRSGIVKQMETDKLLTGTKDSDNVRIIVEMDEDCVISKATAKGLRLDEMDKAEVNDLQQNALNQQKSVQKTMKSKKINYELLEQFTDVFNGFSVNTTLKEAKSIEKLDGVKSVSIVNKYARPQEPDMTGSDEMTGATTAWANGYDGEGTVVAIIDTGIDYSHKDMVLSEDTDAKLTEDEVNKEISEEGLPGEFKSEKVPYGYNYMDENDEVLDLGPGASMHGMHVAGIVGANGDTENGGIKGTAPECQLLAMKVFGNNPIEGSCYGDVLIKAMDDSVKLGADVMNMSLGAPSGFVDDSDPEQIAVNNAVANGVVASISAGNENAFGDGYDNPYASNPDYGVLGSPSSSTDAFSVASVENAKITGYSIEFKNGEKNEKYPFSSAGNVDIIEAMEGKELKVVDCGYGNYWDFPMDEGEYIALVQRGELAFTDKITNAEDAGAAAIIIYNNQGDGLLSMAYPDYGTIPAVFTTQSAGESMLEASQGGTVDVNVKFTENLSLAENPAGGQVSDFTSWGVTSELVMKPDIAGVGGNVWSTANDNKYQVMSGTSMASPNIAGSSAVVYQLMAESDAFKALSGKDKVNMAKSILMSTAVPTVDSESGLPVSPRRQGAGLVNLAAATTSPATVTEAGSQLSKVNLKEIKGDKATFKLTVHNYSDKEVAYNVKGTVQSDGNLVVGDTNYNLLAPQAILNGDRMPITFSKDSIKVPAKGTQDIEVTVDLSYTKLANGMTLKEAFENGTYVEGFVTLTDPKDTNPELSVPYMGFYGDWNKAPIMDNTVYDEGKSFYGDFLEANGISSNLFSLVYEDGEGYWNFMGFKPEDSTFDSNYLDMSPNGDDYFDSVYPILTMLRNAKEFGVEILDSNGNVVKTLESKENVRKNAYDGKNLISVLNIMDYATWDGTIDGKLAPEGTYTYRVKAKLNYEGADWQYKDFKVNLDVTAPTIDSMHYDEDTHVFTVNAEDNFKGHISYYRLLTPDEPIDSYDGKFDLTELVESGYSLDDCTLGVVDYAMNVAVKDLAEPQGPAAGDREAPVVEILDPLYYAVMDTDTIELVGIITDESSLDSVTVNDKPVDYSYLSFLGGWIFNVDIPAEEGINEMRVNAKDSAGNELEYMHRVIVDTTAPELTLDDIPAVTTKDTVRVTGTVNENLPSVTVKLNGSIIHKVDPDWGNYDVLEPTSYTIDNEYKLSDGENIITVEAQDAIGHVSAQTLTITKVASLDVKNDNKMVGSDRYATAVNVSKNGWDKSNYAVLANGDAYTDALVSAPLASAYSAPILLTEKDHLTDVTADELQRLGVEHVFITGGTNVVSNDVVNALSKAGIASTRLGGHDRYETSVVIAKYIDRQQDIKDVYVTGGFAVADAVTISSKAAMDMTPIILVENKTVPETVEKWLSEQELENATVVGGTAVVSDSVLSDLDEITSSEDPTVRISGADRFDTNAEVIDTLFPEVVDSVMVTGSDVFVDALVAAPYAAQKGAPIVIAKDAISASQADVMDKMLSFEVEQVGGRVSVAVINDIAARLSVQK